MELTREELAKMARSWRQTVTRPENHVRDQWITTKGSGQAYTEPDQLARLTA